MARIVRMDTAYTTRFSDLEVGDYFFFYGHRNNVDIPLYLVINKANGDIGLMDMRNNDIDHMNVENDDRVIVLPENSISITWFNPLVKE